MEVHDSPRLVLPGDARRGEVVDLAFFGPPVPPLTRFLYVTPATVVMGGVAGPAGCLVTPTAVPSLPALVGTVFSIQEFQVVPGAPLGFLATNGVTLTIS